MPVNRFYHPGPLSDTVLLEGSELKHLTQVVRTVEGEQVELFDGKGTLATAVVSSVSKREAHLKIETTRKLPPPRELTLAQALTRTNRLDMIVEKCTELGMTELLLFPGDRSERKELSAHKQERLLHLMVAACKQSGRVWLPKLAIGKAISKWEKDERVCVYGDPSGSTSLIELRDQGVDLICNGPESGFSEPEQSHLQELGFIPCRWNEAVLRTETAAIAAVAVLLH